MTRTWYSLPEGELFAVAGVWRQTVEWGDAYTMVMADGCPQDWEQWLDGSPDEAIALCHPRQDELIVERTATPWAAPKAILSPRLI